MAETRDLDVAYVAKLARLNLSAEETELFQAQLGEILRYADNLLDLDVREVEPSAHASASFNVFRKDEPRAWLSAEEALRNAPHQANGLFIVTKVVE